MLLFELYVYCRHKTFILKILHFMHRLEIQKDSMLTSFCAFSLLYFNFSLDHASWRLFPKKILPNLVKFKKVASIKPEMSHVRQTKWKQLSGRDMLRNKGRLNFVTFEHRYTTVAFFYSLIIPWLVRHVCHGALQYQCDTFSFNYKNKVQLNINFATIAWEQNDSV